jgi:hypothetical protein
MSWILTEGLHWGVALIPVLVLLAVFVWLDAFALMSLNEVLVLPSLADWPRCSHGPSADG